MRLVFCFSYSMLTKKMPKTQSPDDCDRRQSISQSPRLFLGLKAAYLGVASALYPQLLVLKDAKALMLKAEGKVWFTLGMTSFTTMPHTDQALLMEPTSCMKGPQDPT